MSVTEAPAEAAPATDVREAVHAVCRRARAAARVLATVPTSTKDDALLAVADALEATADRIVGANAADLERGRRDGLAEGLLDRLSLDHDRVAAIAAAVRHVASLSDPVGEVVRGSTLANGLRLRQVRVPMGVVGMIYEARPNVTVDAAVLAVKSGNAAVLRGGSAARSSNELIVDVVRDALAGAGLPADAVTSIDGLGRDGAAELMRARGLVDLLVPRGGAGLIRTVVETSTVPVIETGTGNCHVYVDASADLDQALAITLNSKTRRVSVCNAAETLLVHADAAAASSARAARAARRGRHGARRRAGQGRRRARRASPPCRRPTRTGPPNTSLSTWPSPSSGPSTLLSSMYAAGRSGHTEAIVTDGPARRRRASSPRSTPLWSPSTPRPRFTDGGEFGLGAEIGISTQKLHARGPMGLTELTSTKWVVAGDGHVRP